MKRRHSWRRINHQIITILEIANKRAKRTADWYKSKHRTSDYFGCPLMVRVGRVSRVVKRWNIGASTSEAEEKQI